MSRTYEFIGNARVATQAFGATTGYTDHGQMSALTLSFSQDKKTLMDKADGTGGVFATHYRVTEVTANATFKEATLQNMLMAYRGVNTVVAADPAAVLTIDIPAVGKIVRLPGIDVNGTTTVTGGVAGVDFKAVRGGVQILSNTVLTAGSSVSCTYSKKAGNAISALASKPYEASVLITGINEVNTDDTYEIYIPRAKFSPIESEDLIGDDFGDLSIKFDVLSNPDATSALDKFFVKTLMQSA